AWFPVFDQNNRLEWKANPNYQPSQLICKSPSPYSELGIEKGKSIYRTFEENPETFLYVPKPQLKASVWQGFEP
ncbi:MAG: glucose-6-phosphate isomerase, partial [Bacteroidales bacterium]|nr:glucose-6-phosphate isomerase [Bacteroidales bacterium]